ncbi:Cytochrome c oxidase subunit 6b-2 [Apostasia shenzhenica]|uniref:Cytochrome c oxidase subunit 6b-2 n=1 Tax=Apostasia shenzhenica TaxID=1088818 RepID=A0A2I0A1K3_9ASPA|nr:Cytochrome c oxidase subunit 6b-2 [Apostasia shenzhenica]PKA49419.1 Cytochrome c oxidase subunit 6b-2 [Apostasia shenzhenica]
MIIIIFVFFKIELKTAPADFRFPTTNQSRHCFTRYIEYHKCLAAKGDGSIDCEKFARYYRSLCPGEWVPHFMLELFCWLHIGKDIVDFAFVLCNLSLPCHLTNFASSILERESMCACVKGASAGSSPPSSQAPAFVVERWNEQRESGTFPGPL